jgi:hypothetical protein
VLTDTDPAAPQMVLIGKGDNVPQALLDAANSVVALSARTPPRTIESRCMSPEVALFGHAAVVAECPLWRCRLKLRRGPGQSLTT